MLANNEVNDLDCCGNGCTHCILNVNSKKKTITLEGKRNILETYSSFKLLKKSPLKEQLNDVLELHFASSLDRTSELQDYILNIPVGQHVMMRKEHPKLLRPYSPYWVDSENLEFKILVILKNGFMSKYIENLNDGDEVEFRGPIGCDEYMHKIDKIGEKCIFIITQGVAIAPSLRIICEILENDEDETRIVHFACFTNLQRVYFREKLHEFNKFWNYSGFSYLSKEQCGLDEYCLEASCCKNDCKNFMNKLRYKERIYSIRLGFDEIREKYENINANDKIFIIAGTRKFQDNFFEILSNKLNIKKESIFLL